MTIVETADEVAAGEELEDVDRDTLELDELGLSATTS